MPGEKPLYILSYQKHKMKIGECKNVGFTPFISTSQGSDALPNNTEFNFISLGLNTQHPRV